MHKKPSVVPFPKLGLTEAFGLSPLKLRLKEMRRNIAGEPDAPRTQWGLSSVRIFKPGVGLVTWLGVRRADKRVPLYNFFNRVSAPKDEGYSVKVSFARDVLGTRHTYDGHLGTDFAVPIGTPVVAAAEGVVLRVANDFDRGGLGVGIDHGRGLWTTCNHMARVCVRVGQVVKRGELVGWSGAAGMEFVLFFPWVAPHVHFNTWLNGEPCDPFAADGEASLWLDNNDPVPAQLAEIPASFAPTQWDEDAVQDAIAGCKHAPLRERIERVTPAASRAAEVLFHMNYRPASFARRPSLYRTTYAREPRLSLPFLAQDVSGLVFPGGHLSLADARRR